MSLVEALSLFAVMAILAAVPSASVALVVARSAASGVANGIAAAAGIVVGDLVFILLAISGLSVLAEALGGLFAVIKYLGAGYLCWLGMTLLRKNVSAETRIRQADGKNLVAGFAAGFILTLGDVKAIFFYASLFPVFVEVPALGTGDVILVSLIAAAGVGGVKLLYALSAARVVAFLEGRRSGFGNVVGRAAGGLMIATGGYLIYKA